MEKIEADLIYNWNQADDMAFAQAHPQMDDETLRDGLQSPSVRTPGIEQKLQLLHLMARLGIQAADIGLPAAGDGVKRDVLRLAQEIREQKLAISPNCAARTVVGDIEPIVDISQQAGLCLEVGAFIGSSPIRQYTEDWNLDHMRSQVETAVRYALDHDLEVMFVTEDTTRAHPNTLQLLYKTAIEAGARRICLCDTVGFATPNGVKALIQFIQELIAETGENVAIDWHGHCDRGLALANAWAALEAGVDRIHGTALGIGERVGNLPLDLWLVNLKLLGLIETDLTSLGDYCRLVSEACGIPIPLNYPVLGRDAFRTATGVHAAAILKALKKGDHWLADRVYSAVPASWIGREQTIEVGPMSGLSNVEAWLGKHGIIPDPELMQMIFREAKRAPQVLTEAELQSLVAEFSCRNT